MKEKPYEGEAGDAPLGRTFVKPEVVVTVRFLGWSDDGSLRFPVFRGVDLGSRSTRLHGGPAREGARDRRGRRELDGTAGRAAPRGAHEPGQDLLAQGRSHEGRSLPLLRGRRPHAPPVPARPPRGPGPVPRRHRGKALLPVERPLRLPLLDPPRGARRARQRGQEEARVPRQRRRRAARRREPRRHSDPRAGVPRRVHRSLRLLHHRLRRRSVHVRQRRAPREDAPADPRVASVSRASRRPPDRRGCTSSSRWGPA